MEPYEDACRGYRALLARSNSVTVHICHSAVRAARRNAGGSNTCQCFFGTNIVCTGESHGATPACECFDSVRVLQVDQAHNWIQERFTHTCDQVGVSFNSLYSVSCAIMCSMLQADH